MLFKDNQLLHAMIIPAAMGTVFYGLKSIGLYLFQTHVSARLYSCITLHSDETEYFDAVLDLIQSHKLYGVNHFVASKPKYSSDSTCHIECGDRLDDVRYEFVGSGDVVSMLYDGRTIYVSRTNEGSFSTVSEGGGSSSSAKMESLTLYVLGTNVTVLKTLISDAIMQANKIRAGWTRIFMMNPYQEKWSLVMSKRQRSIDSVVFDKKILIDVIDDVRQFINSRQWYEDMNIPYRRGYLFYGPPGCGKTSICQVLAGALEFDICVLSLSVKSMCDSRLLNVVRKTPLRSILILEDVDAVFTQRVDTTSMSSVTFSGLLNAIDGVVSREGVILVMTTNHIDRLDPALIRPGRCDMKIKISNASYEQLMAMFLRFFPDQDDAAHRFASCLPVDELSLAQIQNHLVQHKHSFDKAIETAHELFALKAF